MSRRPLGRLYIITDRMSRPGQDPVPGLAAVLSALPRGAAVVQLREKDLSDADLAELARRALDVARRHDAPLLINSNVDVALAVGADGVHLPEATDAIRPRADFLLGRSTHTAAAAAAAARAGVDIVVCGPVWDTPSKRRLGEPIGLEALRTAAKTVADERHDCRLYAIGGIETRERAAAAINAGTWGVAAIRAFSTPEQARRLSDTIAQTLAPPGQIG